MRSRLPVAVVAGLLLASIFRKGAFHPSDALVVAAASCVVIAIEHRRFALLPIFGFTAWWFAIAAFDGHPVRFLPIGASFLGFTAAFLAMRDVDRTQFARLLVAIGAASALVGLVAQSLHLFPFAERAQDLWRIATTLTYSNAAGLLFAMCLLIALGLDPARRETRVGITLCVAGLLGTESRGALLALLLCLPFALHRRALQPAVFGLAIGVGAIASSAEHARQPIVLVAVVLGCVSSALRPKRTLVIAATGVIILVSVFALHAPVDRRLHDDRVPEWHAAINQFTSAPLAGVGPDKPLVLPTGGVTEFAESEYLQVLAGSGLVGMILLLFVILGVGSTLTRRDSLARACGAAVLAFGLAGAVDFVWHIPALAILAGASAGLAARPPTISEHHK